MRVDGTWHPSIYIFQYICIYTYVPLPKTKHRFSYVTSRKRLEEHLALWFFQQLIVGLDYLHRMVRRNRAGRLLGEVA